MGRRSLSDLSRWREEAVLPIYMQKEPPGGGEPTDLYVIDFSFAGTEEQWDHLSEQQCALVQEEEE